MNLGGYELLILLVIAVVIFGGSWLPRAARNLGRAKVEVDKAQQQFNEARAQVVEATGLDKADAALNKANRALNQSPKTIMKNAARSAAAPAPSPTADSAARDDGAGPADVDDAEIVDRRDPPSEDDTVNVDFS